MRISLGSWNGVGFFAAALVLTGSTGCKKKSEPYVAQPSVPAPRRAYSVSSYSDLCSKAAKPFDGTKAYKKSKSAPSKVAFFQKYTGKDAGVYRELSEPALKPFAASTPEEVELVTCVESTRADKADEGQCSYYGGTVYHYTVTHVVRVLEAKTGKELSNNEFVLDARSEKCPSTYSFPKGSSSVWVGADIGPRLLGEVLPFEPSGVKLPDVHADDFDAVCSGSVVPQALSYDDGSKHKVRVVYFPEETHSSTTSNLPAGIPAAKDDDAVNEVDIVACVTAKPQATTQECDFFGGGVVELQRGEVEVQFRAASTGKLLETKSFKASSPDGCPYTHKFWGKRDRRFTKIDASFAKRLAQLEGGAPPQSGSTPDPIGAAPPKPPKSNGPASAKKPAAKADEPF